MLNYIFLAHSLSNIGGAQLYISKKAAFLKSKGFNAIIVAGKADNIILDDLKKYYIFQKLELLYSYLFYSRYNLTKITCDIYDYIKNVANVKDDTFIIQSPSVNLGLFANDLSKKLQCSSFIYNIAENDFARHEEIAKFVSFKMNKREFVGSSKSSTKMYLKDYPGLYEEKKNIYFNVPIDCSNLLDDTGCNFLKNQKDTFRLLSISRVEKKYLPLLVDEIIKASNMYKDRKFLLSLLVDKHEGCSFNSLIKSVVNLPNNMEVNILGPCVPLKKSIFMSHDIYIGYATSALYAISVGMPTIIADTRSNKSVGIFGVDIDDYGLPESVKTISYEISRIIKNPDLLKQSSKQGLDIFQTNFDSELINNKFYEYILSQNGKNNQYFNINYSKISLSYTFQIKRLFIYFFGIRFYGFIKKQLRV